MRVRDINVNPPQHFGESVSDANESIDSEAAMQAQNMRQWNDFFSDPHLLELVEAALMHNQELQIINQEVLIAQNEVMAKKGEYLPSLGLSGEAGIEKVGEFTHQGATDSTTEYEPGKFVPKKLHNYAIGLHLSWEVDVWKRMRNAKKAAVMRFLASKDGRNFVQTKLIAEVASSYYELLALDAKLDIVSRNIEIFEEALDLVRAQKDAARVTSIAVKRFEAELYKNQSRRFDLQQKIFQVENRINLLAGRFPQTISRQTEDFINTQLDVVKEGIPSDLLRNRPDISQAERELAAAKLDVKSARAQFFPSLSIEAHSGFESFRASHLLKPESVFYNVMGNLTAPLLNRKGIKAAYANANAKQMQSILHYEQKILNGFTEVVNQLRNIDNLQNSLLLKKKQVDSLQEAVDASVILFNAARADYVEVLLTQREMRDAQLELVEVKERQLVSYVTLYQALGGGWTKNSPAKPVK
ncbi:MAG: efflux transporter outer membrane subunit [Deltaproteobacteria bacterium]|nr:efflux transporter outer membrane subunit [Deltaproteobacteria bacterium]